ncbi:hypothetical protein [Staphylococcus gallinarum]|uniref:hypothetical protein n=1 Tax=Staphylococcus gallinarum TaxID=1293 RepID=UPI001E4A479F|nr:hypothetical protein [Staphylococcus gallinarum]MCD8845164.1 hypothetical protein [Staphylococcus gallinarum]
MKDSQKKSKNQKKQERKEARKFLKAKFNNKFGYWFIAIGYFIKNNFKAHTKKIAILLAAGSLLLMILSIINIAKMNEPKSVIKDYQAKNEKLQPKLNESQDAIDQQDDKISEYDVSNDSQIVTASDVIGSVFKGMYNITSSDEYNKARKDNLKHFKNSKDKWIEKIYSDNKDDTGESMIDNLNLTSELQAYDLYSSQIEPSKDDVVTFTAIVEYQSEIKDVSNEYATRTHQSVINVKYDLKDNKIINMKKENKLNTLNTVN